MSFVPYVRRALRIAALWLLVAMCVTEVKPDERPDPNGAGADNVRIRDRSAAWAVRRTLRAAARRLARPGCQRIFSDFVDGQGRSLQASLDDVPTNGAAFLDSLLFYDGSRHELCQRSFTYAMAWPGSHIVLVCIVQFQKIALRDPRLADAILIHEALHALGLGENPPSSWEITNRVMARCIP